MTMSKRFFCYSADQGMVFYNTEQEAKTAAEEELAQYRKDAQFDGEWPMEVEDLRWGEVKQRATLVPEDDESGDYTLQAVEA